MDTEDDPPEPKYDHRKIWGAGFHAGLKAQHGLNGEPANMNELKATAKFRNLTEIERRVLEVIPIKEQWRMTDILTEYSRHYGLHMTMNKFHRCVARLFEFGFVIKGSNDTFSREPLEFLFEKKEPKTPVKLEVPSMKIVANNPAAFKGTPLEQLFTHVDQLREMISVIESDVIAVDEYLKAKLQACEKLDQLKSLLNSI